MKNNLFKPQKGFASILVTLIILAGIVLGTYLALHQQIFNPHASDNQTRVEFIDSNGNVITQTSSRNVTLKITYVSLPISIAPAASGITQSASVPGSSVSVSGSSTVSSTGDGSVNVQFSGPSASVTGGSVTSSNSQQVFNQSTQTVTQNGQTTTTTTSSGNPSDTSLPTEQFPGSFRVANSLSGLSSAQSVDFTQNGQQVNWLLDAGDGLKTVYVEFQIGGIWRALTIGTISLQTPQTVSQTTSASQPSTNSGLTAATAVGLASFTLREGTPVPAAAVTGSAAVLAAAASTPAPTPQVSGGVVTNGGTATGGKITLPNGRVIQGGSAGNGEATNGTISSPVPTAQNSTSPQAATAPNIVEIPIQLLVQSDTDAANLFSAKLVFDATKFQVDRIDTSSSFITNWVTNVFDNSTGTISLVGGVPNPGFKTSGAPAVMATIYLRSSNSGAASLSIDSSSAIYRNADNVDILHSNAPVQSVNTNGTGTITGGSPLPSFIPSAKPVVLSSSSPFPSSTTIASTGGSNNSSSSQGNSSSSSQDVQCLLNQTNFSTDTASSGSVVTVSATGNTACNGQTVTFQVNQDNGLLGQQQIDNPPPPATFDNGTATSTWVTQSNNGVLGGLLGSSGYSLTASLPNNNQAIVSGQNLKVDKSLSNGGFKKGDVNHDGSITLEDLSVFLSDFGAGKGVPEMDMNNDGVVNAVDFSALIALLKQQGVTL